MNLELKIFTDCDFDQYHEELAKLRLSIFQEYPYLYDGSLSYDKDYLNRYEKNSNSSIVLILHNTELVGVSTSIPLEYEIANIKKPFIDKGFNIDEIYYFVESLILPPYRGQGIYRKLFEERERIARRLKYKYATFCSIERSDHDTNKPNNYSDLSKIWINYGYKRHPKLVTFIKWKEIGITKMKNHKLVFWIKELS